ncbi:hypothetical protein TrVE_jg5946 [Triparma verrucosa]|uniref:Amidase domain-containing protein n=1 Tax=Triparma verrucosa TaxID=1606542 RepID=A0A9W7EU08_9STRA|nr:hypothetical protein TrVE_jg5946 [Triparma verrucosa]
MSSSSGNDNDAEDTIASLAKSISSDSSAVTSAQVVSAHLALIDASSNNSVVVKNPRALDHARQHDLLSQAQKQALPLGGVPVTIKLHIDVAGLISSDGVRQYTPASNSPVIDALVKAGAIILGKTNVPVTCADYQSYNSIFGTTKNPLDSDLSPGGSSGGSASAVAEKLTQCCIGTDIGGSVRVPASFCGVFSHKPSWGIISKQQSHPKAPKDMSTTGPIARNARDLATVFDVLASNDSPGREQFSGLRNAILPRSRISSLSGVSVAVWSDDESCPVSASVSSAIKKTVALLKSQGAKVKFTKPAFDSEHMLKVYRVAVAAAMASEASPESLSKFRLEADTNEEAKWMVASHREWLSNEQLRAEIKAAYAELFEEYDILLTPTFPCPAFPHDQSDADQPFWRQSERKLDVVREDGEKVALPYFRGCFWPSVANLPLLPATSFPVYLEDAKMPVGLQAVGRELGDRTTLDFVRLLENVGAESIARYKEI